MDNQSTMSVSGCISHALCLYLYLQHADAWRTSPLCQLAGVLAMLSSEVSVFMLTAITMERTMAIIFPLKMGKFRMKYARLVALLGWGICLFLTLIPTTRIEYFGNAFFGRTGEVCYSCIACTTRLEARKKTFT